MRLMIKTKIESGFESGFESGSESGFKSRTQSESEFGTECGKLCLFQSEIIIPFPVWIILFPFFLTSFRLVSKSKKHFVKKVFRLVLRKSEESIHFLFG